MWYVVNKNQQNTKDNQKVASASILSVIDWPSFHFPCNDNLVKSKHASLFMEAEEAAS